MEVLSIDCPMCGSSGLSINQKFLDIPHFGEVMVSSINCDSCGYRHTDVLPTSTRTPKRYTFSFSDETGLNARVIRSGSSTVRIPDLGIRIDPGGASEGYITNIEGLLLKIIGIMDHIDSDLNSSLTNPEADPVDIGNRMKRSRELRKILERIMDGKSGTTIIIEDPYGNSAIIHNDDNVLIEDLTEEEIVSLLGVEDNKTGKD